MRLPFPCSLAPAWRQRILLASACAVAVAFHGPAVAAACDHIRHDQLKYAECMRNDPSRNTPPGGRQEYQVAPGQQEPAQENAYDRERRLQREAAEAERKRREDDARNRELLRRRQQMDAEQREIDARRAQDLALAKRIRANQERAVAALAVRLKDPKFDTPDTYDEIITAAAPEVDLMTEWAKKALARFPNEFAFRHWLVMRSSCHPISSVARFDPGLSPYRPCMPERQAAPAEIPAAARQGSLADRVLNCAYIHFGFGTEESTWGAGYLSEGAGVKSRWERRLAHEKAYTDVLADCEKDLGAALPDVKEGLFKMMFELGKSRKNALEAYDASFIWLWRSQAVWSGRTSIAALRDPRTAALAIEKTHALYIQRLRGE
jgi:hypothetical protein